jgi:hypothetical protein
MIPSMFCACCCILDRFRRYILPAFIVTSAIRFAAMRRTCSPPVCSAVFVAVCAISSFVFILPDFRALELRGLRNCGILGSWRVVASRCREYTIWLTACWDFLFQLLDDLVEVLSGGINVSGPSGARNSHALRAPPSLGLGSNAQGHASEVGARDSWLDISSDDVLKVAVRAAEVKGGEVWIWGGAVRFPLLRPPYDGTLGLTLFGSVKMLVSLCDLCTLVRA